MDQKEDVSTEDLAALFKALGDPTRLKLVRFLHDLDEPASVCVNALAGYLGVSQSAVSQHLRILKNVGLVRGERKGYHVHYSLDKKSMTSVHALMSAAHDAVLEY